MHSISIVRVILKHNPETNSKYIRSDGNIKMKQVLDERSRTLDLSSTFEKPHISAVFRW